MKKIGILYGKERSFPDALIERVNSKNVKDIVAEPVKIDKVVQGEPTQYAVIIDRISQDVPFYRAYLKNAAIGGAARCAGFVARRDWQNHGLQHRDGALAVVLCAPTVAGLLVRLFEMI